jgi:uridine kinase
VAVDGITGAGKTTFADELAEALTSAGIPTLRVTMDGFHHPRATRYRQGRDSAAGYYEDAYDFVALRRELLDPLGDGGGRRYRTEVIDLARDTPLEQPRQQAPDDLVVIVDGSFLQREELDGAWDVVVYLRVSFATARARGVDRDAPNLGSHEAAERLFAVRYHRAQQRYLDEHDPEARADIVVDNDDLSCPVVLRSA